MSDDAFARLAPISLADLIGSAELLTRVDRKYVLSRTDAAALLAALPTLATPPSVLEIAGVRSSEYGSVYFDTPDLLSYRMAATNRRRRFKLRTRSYLDVGEAYLEVKTRGARSTTVKDRLPYDIDRRAELTPAGRGYVDESLVGLGLPAARIRLAPTLVTTYRRTTLHLPDAGSRATVDTDLAWEGDDGRTLRLPDTVIVETKSAARISVVDRLLWRAGHRPSTVSKYGTGMAALHPELPANKWARVLRRHFL